MYISRIEITNFRNFQHLDVRLGAQAVIVGENKVGKSNLLYALRLLLDPSLPDTSRQLRAEDFWDGLARPITRRQSIEISIELSDIEGDADLEAVLADCPVRTSPMVARIGYLFAANEPSDEPMASGTDPNFDFSILAGAGRNEIAPRFRRFLPMELLHALRDAEGDLANWRKSPLRPLIDRAAESIDAAELATAASNVTNAAQTICNLAPVAALNRSIGDKLEQVVGKDHSVDPQLGVAPTDPGRLLRSLQLLVDGGTRGIGDASLGSANLLYLTLRTLELESLARSGDRQHTFLAIEEPEAHLHPHLQRLVYREFLRRRNQQEAEEGEEGEVENTRMSLLVTTHSPHVASVAPLPSLVLLRRTQGGATLGRSTASLALTAEDVEDIERYLDVTRAEMLFGKAVLLVEGDAERFLVPRLAELNDYDLDELGITVSSVSGTNFVPYLQLLGREGLDIPWAVVTDYDPQQADKPSLVQGRLARMLGRGLKLPAADVPDDADERLAFAGDQGIFVNDWTFEVDLFHAGQREPICDALQALSTVKKARDTSRDWIANPESLKEPKLLGWIDRIGKGRFAQRLASTISTRHCPDYLLDALAYLKERLAS